MTELVVVLLVIAVLSSAALPSLQGLTGARENVAATRVRTVVAFAHSWATSAGRSTWVVFDAVAERASVFVEDPDNPGKANRLTLADPLTRSPLVLQLGENGVGLEAADFDGGAEVEFDSSGTPRDENGDALTADGTVEVTGSVIVRVTRGTGLVTVD